MELSYKDELCFGDTPMTIARIAELEAALNGALLLERKQYQRAERAEAKLAEQDELLDYIAHISPITVTRCREDLMLRARAEEGSVGD